MLNSDLAKQAWLALPAWPRKACFLMVAIALTSPAISHCRARARGSRYHEIYGWHVTFPDLKAAEATVDAKRHPPAKLINLTMLVSRTVTAIQPLIRGRLPDNITEAQRQVLLQRRDAEIMSIEKKMLGTPAVVPFKLNDVVLKRHGGYIVTGVLDWKSPLYHTPAASSDSIPSQHIAFETDHQRVLGWTVGTNHQVYALADSVRGLISRVDGGPQEVPYLRLNVALRLISFSIPHVAAPVVKSAAPAVKFIVHLSNGGKLLASVCKLHGGSYRIVADGMVLDLPKKRVSRVEVITGHVATTQPTAKH